MGRHRLDSDLRRNVFSVRIPQYIIDQIRLIENYTSQVESKLLEIIEENEKEIKEK